MAALTSIVALTAFTGAASAAAPDGQTPAYRASIFGTLETDVDKDGYGDETQDGCPQSAALQNACPVLSISQKLPSSRSAISALASTSVDTSLAAEAVVKIPKIGKSKAHDDHEVDDQAEALARFSFRYFRPTMGL